MFPVIPRFRKSTSRRARLLKMFKGIFKVILREVGLMTDFEYVIKST